ncbi:MAG: hypothetical protein ACM3VS_18090 [Candidatus Dadabacteria bacterium]
MEDLFSTNINLNNESIVYRVIFDHEKYLFIPGSDDKRFPTFSFKREHDEWHEQDTLPPDLKKQALEALEKYLLKQH